MNRITVVAQTQADRRRAEQVAEQLGLSFGSYQALNGSSELLLVVAMTGDYLLISGPKAPGPIEIDFDSAAMRHRRRGGHNELLGKAIGVKGDRRPSVVDATAGLGRDAFVLADLGCRVEMRERSMVLCHLLQQALVNGASCRHDNVREAVARMSLHPGSAQLSDVSNHQVIYLDPMFEDSGKKAAAKKDLAVLQKLHRGADDSGALVEWALSQPVSRVVIKRPLKASPLTPFKPTHVIRGSSIRFDVVVRAEL